MNPIDNQLAVARRQRAEALAELHEAHLEIERLEAKVAVLQARDTKRHREMIASIDHLENW